MKTVGAFVGFIGLAARTGTGAQAASTRPSIVITAPTAGAVLHGSHLTVHVAIAHFKLVAPILVNPPVLQGMAGHIHYLVDGSLAFAQSASTSYTWSHVAPGRHTITAYLATSQHFHFPGTATANVTITLAAAPAPPVAHHQPSPGISHAPTTGGGADIAASPLNFSLLLTGLLSIILGLSFLTTRHGWFRAGRRREVAHAGAPSSVESINDRIQRSIDAAPVGAERPMPPSPIADEGDADSPLLGAHTDERATTSPPDGHTGTTIIDAPEEEGSTVSDESYGSSLIPLGTTTSAEETVPTQVEQERPSTEMATPPGDSEDGQIRTQAVQMAQQWAGVVEGLVRQLNQQDGERHQLLTRIQALEEAVQADRSLHEQLRNSAADTVAGDELQKLRYVTNSLIEDPDHIVVLAAVAQHAGPLKRLVEDYARIRHMLEGT